MTIFHPLTIKNVTQETRDAVSITFDVPMELKEAYQFTQGQHLTLKEKLGGEEYRRSYSICSAVGDDELRVAIKQIDGGVFSSHANENFAPGQILEVMEPQGRFYSELNAKNANSYLAIAVGSGITPIISIVKTILKTEKNSQVTLIYGNRSVTSILFLEELEDLKNIYKDRLNLMHILSREHQDAELFNGRVTGEKCKQIFGTLVDLTKINDVFLCGPEQMIMEVKEVLQNSGVDPSHIHFELFITDAAIKAAGIPKKKKKGEGPKRQVRIILDGRQSDIDVREDGRSILDVALSQGMDLPYACKGGVCSTCRAKVVRGEVQMDLNYALEDSEVAEGYVLTCQSHPLTEDVIVDYDA
ncbi:phenylacetate-CoA oxygenase/reductase subunit PaaK [Sneathiella marina]|uniref:Phenylacetate-CoA oxygenase/reductase subunit PaaK n=1 Tax=Sneathiella marina TaxID=2950108 RepID=A0ABY4WB79_9PROT|nr:1,2-phenylacetyl-CoA epoxidase subunit PaaE [Sneathiella marina]USG63025.1 phenylacetate-CoA oxygenase/reductase subunit PaaK [Sneathiella marina]